MPVFSLVFALSLTLLGALVLAALLKVLWSSLPKGWTSGFSITGLREKAAIRQLDTTLKQADDALQTNNYTVALPHLRKGFNLTSHKLSPELLNHLHNHYLAVLNRILAISDKQSSHLSNLPIVEDLLDSRIELLRARIEAGKTHLMLLEKQRGKGKESAQWAISEYKKKLADLEDQLLTNRRSLESQLDRLFTDLKKVGGTDQVTYH